MKRMSLRAWMQLMYTFMALLPVTLAGVVLMLYLRAQISQSSIQLQASAQEELSHYRQEVEQFVEQVLRTSIGGFSSRMEQRTASYRAKALQEQKEVLERGIEGFRTQSAREFVKLQQTTQQNLKQTLDDVAQNVQNLQQESFANLAATTSDTTRSVIAQLVTNQLQILTDSLSRQIESVFRNYTTQLTLLAQQPAIQNDQEQESRWILQALQNRENAYLVLAKLDAEGKPRLMVSDEPIQEEVLRPALIAVWNSLQDTNDPVIGEAVLIPQLAQRTLLVPIIVPVRQRGTQFTGALFALVNIDELNRVVRQFRIGNQGYAMLVSGDARILAHPDPAQIGQHETLFAPQVGRSPRSTSQEVSVGKATYLVGTAPIRALRATLITVQPTEDAYALANQIQDQLATVFQTQKNQASRAIQQIGDQATQQIDKHLASYQSQLAHLSQDAQQKALRESLASLNTLNQQQRRELETLITGMLNSTLNEVSHELNRQQAEVFERTNARFESIGSEMTHSITDQMRNAFLLALGAVLVCMLWGGLLLHKKVIMPLRTLVGATHDIAQGDLNRRVELPERGIPDLDDLADSFNHMVDVVQQGQEELKRAEAQLIQSSKLASLGTLASGVAHELNQPLAIIRAIAQQTLDTMEAQNGTLTEQDLQTLQEDLQIVSRQTQRMSQIIMHLRTFARKPREEQDPVDLNTVVQNALVLLREQLRNRGITLTEDYTTPLPTVLGEPNSLEQIVINLLTNARDALEDRPDAHITIQTRVSHDEEGEWVELAIADNGPGVPHEIVSQIFDPFFTTKDPNKGTGLGLAISLEIAQKHRGTLRLIESPQGACFVLRLPVAQEQRQVA
ncbi:MAG: ATP-binding protein [Fimbriimonadales bacterium]